MAMPDVNLMETQIRLLEEEVHHLKVERHILQYTLDAVLAKAMGEEE